MLEWLKFWKKKDKKGEMEKITEVMRYEEEALRRITRIAALRDELYEDFEEEDEERPKKVQKGTQGGIINYKGIPIRGHGKFK